MKKTLINFINWYKETFSIPNENKQSFAERNLQYLRIISLVLSIFGIVSFLFYYNLNQDDPIRQNMVFTYYLGFFVSGIIFFCVSILLKKNKNANLKEMVCTLMVITYFGLCAYMAFIPGTALINSILFFSTAAIIITIIINLNPLSYTIITLLVFGVLLYRGITTNYDWVPTNILWLTISMCLVSFSRRKMVVTDIKQKILLEKSNSSLTKKSDKLQEEKTVLSYHNFLLEREIDDQAKSLKDQNEKIIEIQNNTILGLSNLVENRDEDTGDHVLRTSLFVKILAEKAFRRGIYKNELTPQFIEKLIKAAPMHDIGKIVVPDAILKKPGRFTPDEFNIMKKHTVEGGRIIEEILGNVENPDYVKIAQDVATFHHEKYDGSGYPYGLSGEQIPLSARIMAVADVFDALVSPRCYKEPMPIEKALDIMKEESGTHFDPNLLPLFIEAKDEAKKVLKELSR